jgi:hypothetical protein
MIGQLNEEATLVRASQTLKIPRSSKDNFRESRACHDLTNTQTRV